MAPASDPKKPADMKLKGKRRRRLEPEIDDFDEYAAAETLLLLANCNADGFCPRSTSRRREFIDVASLPTPQSLTAHPAADAANYGPAVNVDKQVSVSPDTPLKEAEIDDGDRDHVCSKCGKRFQSHQALGEHMTCHRLKPPTTTPSDGGNVSSAVRIHECSDCHEQFTFGQALGGHVRKHKEQSNAEKAPATSPSISCHIVSDDHDGAATKLKIDLNMPPPEESDS